MVMRGRPRRERVEQPDVAADADEVAPQPAAAESVQQSEVIGLGVQEIATLPTPLPEPALIADIPGPLPEPIEAEALGGGPGSVAEVADLPLPLPEPVGAVGYGGEGGNPPIMTASGLGEVADLPGSLPEPFQVGRIDRLADEEGPVPASEPTGLLAEDEEGPVQP